MEFNRNQVFFVGMLLLLLGVHFYSIDSLVLTPQATKLLAEQGGHPVATASNTVEALVGAETPFPAKTVYPPVWLGWFLMSAGSVLVLHSWTMAKPA